MKPRRADFVLVMQPHLVQPDFERKVEVFIGPGSIGITCASRALQQVWVFMFFDPGPGASEGPGWSSWAIRGPSRGLRGPS